MKRQTSSNVLLWSVRYPRGSAVQLQNWIEICIDALRSTPSASSSDLRSTVSQFGSDSIFEDVLSSLSCHILAFGRWWMASLLASRNRRVWCEDMWSKWHHGCRVMIDLNLLSRRLEPPLPCWATTWTSWLSLQLVLGSGKSWVCPKMGSQKHGNFDGKSTDQPWDCGYGIFRSMYCLLAMFQVPMVLQKPSLRDEALQCPCKRIVLASALKARQAVVFANSTAFVGMQSESQLFPHFCRFTFLCPCTFTLSYQLCLDETQPRWLSFEQWIPRFKTLDSCPKMAILMGKGSHADHGVLEGFGTAGRNLRHLLSRQYITWNGLFQRCFERRRCSAEALPSWSCPCWDAKVKAVALLAPAI